MTRVFLLAIIYLAFISLGLPDSVLGVAWPFMRTDLGARLEAAGLIALILTGCSAISSLLNARLSKRFGTGVVVTVSCVFTAIGLLGYSLSPSYAWVLVAALPLGFGQGAVDSTLNGYVAAHFSSRHMNWLHASWGIGATIGPVIMTQTIRQGGIWRNGYQYLSLIQALLALVLLCAIGLWKRGPGQAVETEGEHGDADYCRPEQEKIHGLRHVEPWLQIVMYGVYTAAEFSVGIWIASFLIEARHVDKSQAGFWASLYYFGIMAGRILTGIVADRLGNRFMIRLGLAVSFVGAAMLLFSPIKLLALPGLLLVGLGFAPVFPCLMHETPRRFDKDTYQTIIGFQMASANIGASVIPGLVGLVAAHTSLEVIPYCVVGFVVLLFIMGDRLNRTT